MTTTANSVSGGVIVKNGVRKDQEVFENGSIFCTSIRPNSCIIVSVQDNSSLLEITTVSCSEDAKLYYYRFVPGENSGIMSTLLCPFSKHQKIVSGLNLKCTGPTKFELRVVGNASVNVFGSVRSSSLSPVTTHSHKTTTTKRKRSNSETKVIVEEQKEKVKEQPNNDIPPQPVDKDENDESSPKQPLSKKQRRKLAKQKAKELADVVQKNSGKQDNNENEDSPNKSLEPTTTLPTTTSKPRRLEGGILVRDIVVTTNHATVKPGRKVKLLYTGTFPSSKNKKPFDKNWNAKAPLEFRQGTRQVIVGLERGIEGMAVGGERIITIPPQLAYGKKGSGNVVPPNATLEFHVKVIGVGGK